METEKITRVAEEIISLLEKSNDEIKDTFSTLEDVEKVSVRETAGHWNEVAWDRAVVYGETGDYQTDYRAKVALMWEQGYMPCIQLWVRCDVVTRERKPELLQMTLVRCGLEKWRPVASMIKEAIHCAKGHFYQAVKTATGKTFSDPETERVVELVALRSRLEAAEEKAGGVEREFARLQRELDSKSAELADLQKEQRTAEVIAKALAGKMAARSELALVNLRLAVQKAISDLAATKGISKSRRFAQIRQDLEAASTPILPEDDSEY